MSTFYLYKERRKISLAALEKVINKRTGYLNNKKEKEKKGKKIILCSTWSPSVLPCIVHLHGETMDYGNQ